MFNRLSILLVVIILLQTFLFASDIEKKVENLLSQMTLEEKIELLGGTKGFYIKGIPRLGIPEIKMTDGPLGVRGNGKSTAFPATVALAATWNRDLAFKVGNAIGKECREKQIGFLLAPAVNIYRAAQDGRNFEYMGEDPFLASEMVVPYVKGVQKNKVVATVKHFVANNQEYDRHWVSSEVDERTLHEIYLPAFKAAIQRGGALAVMAAYNPLNGVHCSENKYLLTDVLKGMWKFKGLVMSDWGAVHSVAAVNAGLDLEMPEAKYMNKQNILPKIESGEIDQAAIDDKVRRILRVCLSMDLYNKNRKKPTIDWEKHHSIALQVAREGIVLLKNKNNILPLNPKKIKKLVVLGPTADPTPSSGGGSAFITPYRHVSFLDAIRQRFGSEIKVDYINITRYPSFEKMVKSSRFFTSADLKQSGLRTIYFNNTRLSAPPVLHRISQTIDYDFGTLPPAFGVRKSKYSIRWRGFIAPDTSGLFVFAAESDDGVRIYLDGELILDHWNDHTTKKDFAEKRLKKGKIYRIRIDYYNNLGSGVIRFGYGLVDETPPEQKLQLVKNYDAAIVCVGFNPELEGEGHDRPFALPEEQNKLIKTVSKLNDRTVVLITAGGGIDFSPWIKDVKAVLHTFYLGQAGGAPVAEVLSGDVNPSGKLPFSIPKRPQDAPAFGNYYPPNEKSPVYQADHKNNPAAVTYAEGIFIGYRHYDKNKIEPQFPFGFGLSYTKFDYDDLELSSLKIGKNDTLKVRFKLRNKGKIAGSEIVQLYVSAEGAVKRPPKELKGFQKIFLKPGEEKTVRFVVTPQNLSYYSEQKDKWIAEAGKYKIMIGSSSRDIRLRKGFLVKP